MAKRETIRKELKELKSKVRLINQLRAVERSHLQRIEDLEKMEKTPRRDMNIEKERDFIKRLNVIGYIEDTRELEEKYLKAIEGLDAIDRTIITEAYINARPYWQIGNEIGYSDEGIRKRVGKILTHLSKAID